MVSGKSERYLNNPNVSLKKLEKSGHYYYNNKEFEYLKAEFKKMLGADI